MLRDVISFCRAQSWQQRWKKHIGALTHLGMNGVSLNEDASFAKCLIPDGNVELIAVHQGAIDVEKDRFCNHKIPPLVETYLVKKVMRFDPRRAHLSDCSSPDPRPSRGLTQLAVSGLWVYAVSGMEIPQFPAQRRRNAGYKRSDQHGKRRED